MSRATLDVRSSVSDEMGVVDVCELREMELSEGDRRLVLRVWLWLLWVLELCLCCALAATAGDNDLPLPRMRPPPSDLRAAISPCCTALHCTVLYCAVQCYTLPYCYPYRLDLPCLLYTNRGLMGMCVCVRERGRERVYVLCCHDRHEADNRRRDVKEGKRGASTTSATSTSTKGQE